MMTNCETAIFSAANYITSAVTTQTSWFATSCNTSITATTSGATNTWWAAQVAEAYGSQQGIIWNRWCGQVAVRKETKRQRLAREARELAGQVAANERVREREEKQKAVDARAEKLLVEHLTPEQAKSLAERRYFDVEVKGKTYRIHRGTHGNVRLLNAEGREKTLYCIQPDGVPAADAMLAQKLHLETNEQEFLRVANARPIYSP